MPVKSPALSKTLWMNLIVAIAAFFPTVNTWVSSNPIFFVVLFSVANMALRFITKDPLIQIE